MVVRLGDGIAHPITREIDAVLSKDLLVCVWIFGLQPGEQCGTDVKTYPLKVVQLHVRAIALLENSFVPVVEWRGPRFVGDYAS